MRQLGVLLLSLLASTPALAQDEPPPESVKGIKLVIPEARGQRRWGRAQLSKALRRTMTEAVGPLIPSRDLARAQRKLRLRGSRAHRPENLAKAAREIGAEYVLSVAITKKGWLYTARALLVNVESGEIQMDFRSQYYKPAGEAADRGKRIGRRTIEKLATLKGEGSEDDGASDPIAVAPPPPDPPASDPDDDLKSDDEELKSDVDDLKSDPGDPGEPSDPVDPVDPGEPDDPPPPVEVAEAPPPPPAETRDPDPPPRSQQVEVEAEPSESREEIIRAMVGGGSGVLRTYNLSSGMVETSGLSHQLSPLSLVAAEIEVTIPGVPISIVLGGSFRPVRYDLGVADASPRGALIDSHAAIGYAIAVAGEGIDAYEITPRVGSRLGFYNVQDHPGRVVLNTRTVSVLGGLGARLPLNSILEIDLGVDGGVIVSYAETPATTGDSKLGFVVAGDLSARIWLTSMIAIAFDNRFTFERITFSGAPTRQLPDAERTLIQDANITTKDLRTSIGVAFRF